MDVLRNLDINGQQVGTVGVNVVAGGTLALENVDIENFSQQCVKLQPATGVGFTAYNTNFERCGQGGLVTSTTSGTERANVAFSHFSKMTGGASVGVGINVGANSKVSVLNCDIENNIGGGVLVGGTNSSVQLQHNMIANNQVFGVKSNTGGTATMADNSVVFNNGLGLDSTGGGSIITWSDNYVSGNNPDGARTGFLTPM
jgi:hypothetical protein